jgi:hypothetical protein
MSFWTEIENIGKIIEAGISDAGSIVGAFNPTAGQILTDIGAVISGLEGAGATLTGSTLLPVIKLATTASVVNQHLAAQISTLIPKKPVAS